MRKPLPLGRVVFFLAMAANLHSSLAPVVTFDLHCRNVSQNAAALVTSVTSVGLNLAAYSRNSWRLQRRSFVMAVDGSA